MISREEKNKVVIDEINREKSIRISKIIIKTLLIIIAIFSLLFLYMYYIGPRGLKTNEIILNDNYPNSFNGIKILHFSDILYGKTIYQNEIKKIQTEINLINPDIVFFTGNIISNDYQINEEEIKELNSFFKNIPYSIGKYAIRGDIDSISFDLILENTGFIILDNESIDIFNNTNDKIHIIGINTNEIKELNNNDDYTITLINNYDYYEKYHLNSNLIFAGNNLGGEIRPFNIPLLGSNKYMNNFYQEGNTKVYISSGLGTIHHMRLFNKPSMNVYRLYKK